MKDFTKVMKALSDPGRVKIVKLLQRRELCVCEIKEAIGLAQSTASKHLRILENAGLITCSKDGLWVNYRLADGSDSPYAANMLGNLRHWLDQEKEVAAVTIRAEALDRFKIVNKN
jgi:ArsR family transcriptional regulator, arsenate/arsenite/antimonite-responsive transcriptional repressor